MSDRTESDQIKKVVELAAPVSRVWRALTDHQEFGTWFGVKLEGPFKTGELSLGQMTLPGYEHIAWRVTVECMESESLFSFRGHPDYVDSDADNSAEPTTLVEFRLESLGEKTRLTITESGFAGLPDSRRDEAFRGNTEGWDIQAKNLAAHVEA